MPLSKITVSALLLDKNSSIYTVPVGAMVADAVDVMNRHRVGSVIVKDGEKSVGIFTERDVLTRLVSAGLDSKQTPVRDLMTSQFQFVQEDDSIEDAMQLMTEKRVRHLPVFRKRNLIGMISIGDLTSWLLKANRMEAENLRRYVFSDYPG
jgi:CBS domain-containing protein